jgi:hypothetical protein
MSLHIRYILGVTNDIQQIVITDEIESGKLLSLCFQVVSECFLDFLEQVT